MGVKLLGKIKIYDIAKKLNLTSKEILEVANKLKIDAKSHLSGIEEHEAKAIEDEIMKRKTKNEIKKQGKGTENKGKMETKKEEKAPVIIRREVIISQEEKTKKKEIVKNEENKGKVGFVERKQNKDYNIVYRNKPNKPMTVSELFGLKNNDQHKKETNDVVEEKNIIEEPKKEENSKVATKQNETSVNVNKNLKQDNQKRVKENRPISEESRNIKKSCIRF